MRALAVSLKGSTLAQSGEGIDSEAIDEPVPDQIEDNNPSGISRNAAGILYIYGAPYFEWTSSPWTDLTGDRIASSEVTFRSPVVIRGGAFDASDNFRGSERDSMIYESQHELLTFRGVLSFPVTLEGLARFDP